METWFPFAMITGVILALVVLSYLFMTRNHIGDPRVFIALAITDLFIVATICTFAIIIGWGTGHFVRLTEPFMKWLGVATVGEVASMLGIVLGWYFKGTTPLPDGTHSKD